MHRRTIFLGAAAVLVASAAVYLVVASRHPEPDTAATGAARWSEAEANPAVLAEALSTERDASVRRTVLERAARGPGALALFRAAWDAADNTAREQLVVEAARSVPGAARWLAEIAASDTPLALRAGVALGTISDRRAAGELVELAIGHAGDSVLVRANAIRALGNAGTAEHVAPLARLLGDATQPLRVREQAALSLGHLHEPVAVRDLASALAAATADPTLQGEQLRISVIRGLEALGTRDARATLEHYTGATRTELAFLQRALGRR